MKSYPSLICSDCGLFIKSIDAKIRLDGNYELELAK
jgi:hypothetical protein